MITKRRFCAVVAAVCLNAAPAVAGCVSNPPNQSDSTFPASLAGKLAFHRYVSYGDGTSQIYLYDFRAHALSQISAASWGISDPMNAVFSRDGAWLLFMGVKNNAWNIFLYPLGSANPPFNLTNSTGGTRNEDPKFSADGTKIVFKQNGDVKIATLSFSAGVPSLSAPTNLTGTAPTTENSMPFLAPDASAVYFATGSGATLGLHKLTLATGASVTFDAPSGLAAYYPIVRGDGQVFYARWADAVSRNDQIYIKTADYLSTPVQAPFNDCISGNSDPWPVSGTNYVFFSSTTAGGYQLYLGDAASGLRWSLTQFGVNANLYTTQTAKLGSSYFAISNLSQGRPAAASTSYNASLTPDKAFDGNTTTTRWDSLEGSGVDPQWLSVDLGAVKTIVGLDLYWDAGALVYAIQTSNDNATWTTIYSTTSGVAWGHVALNVAGSGRYVRMYGTQRATPWGYSLDEMQVWGY